LFEEELDFAEVDVPGFLEEDLFCETLDEASAFKADFLDAVEVTFPDEVLLQALGLPLRF
jgi:hypothetical protein